jgi:hypothetical protein
MLAAARCGHDPKVALGEYGAQAEAALAGAPTTPPARPLSRRERLQGGK